jgi:prolyl oligopeptidase
VVDRYHGIAVVDPYRWLEASEDAKVRAWSVEQTRYTEHAITARPAYGATRARVEGLLRVGSVEPPSVIVPRAVHEPTHPLPGSMVQHASPARYIYRRQAPDQDHPVLYARDGSVGRERVLIDPSSLSGDHTTSLDWWVPSWDGRLLAYGLSKGGTEDSTLWVLDVDTAENLPETEIIPRARYASVAWLPDGSGFYYSRYPAPGTVPTGEEQFHRRIFEHRIGRAVDLDAEVFGAGRAMTDMPSVEISPSGRWLVASVSMGWSRREAYLKDRAKGPAAPWARLAVPDRDAIFDVAAFDDHLLVRTNDGAPTYRLYRVDPEHPERSAWQEILRPAPHVLVEVTEIRGELFANYIVNACSVLKRFSSDGRPKGEVRLPTLGTVHHVSGAWNGNEAFFDFTSFVIPSMVFRLDLQAEEPALWAEARAPFEASEYVVDQEWATSKDGTRFPMFVTRKKETPRDGSAAVLLSGYGGFDISQLPAWSGARYAFLDRGGVSVVANLRGGGEYGEAWHRAGMLEHKQNVFDDFIAAAEHLTRTGLTSPDRLAILGGSNGGLLVGAAMTQRPDLFRASVCLVPLLDMLRYERYLLGKLWIPEYGSVENPAQFAALYAYSPYHHVVRGTHYPAVFLAAAEGDTRVDPLHARKMAALLQDATAGSDRPVLLRIEDKAGHGAGKPIAKRVDEAALIYTFLFWQLGME